jgi:hypothetical protein
VRRCGLVLSLLLSWPALAAPADYAMDSGDWNGLSTLASLAAARGCRPLVRPTLDWESLSQNDALWVVYPQATPDGALLRRFIATGGRALLADDFGAAAPTFAELGIVRSPLPSHPDRAHYQERPHLPIAHHGLLTELGRSTHELVANHPTALRSTLPATFLFDADAALVVEGRIGQGRFVALSDPSVLINNMLEVEGNRAFAEVLAAESCRPGGRIFFVTGRFASTGHPAGIDDTHPVDRINQLGLQLNAALGQLGQDPSAASVLGCTLVLVLGLVLMRVADRGTPFNLHFAALVSPETERNSRKETALHLLKEEVSRRIRQEVGDSAPESTLRRALNEALGPSLGHELYQLHRACRRARRRNDAALPVLCDRALALFRRLDHHGPHRKGVYGDADA